jgi:uridine kinase
MVSVIASSVRPTVQVNFGQGYLYEAPKGTRLLEFVRQYEADSNPPPSQRAVAALVDNRLRELNTPMQGDVEAQPISLLDSDGMRIYRRSLAFMMAAAAHYLFPQAQLFIEHALPQRAFYCRVEGYPNFTHEQIKQLEAQMRQMVEQDLPIVRQEMALDDAKRFFAERQDVEKIRLLQFRTRPTLRIYHLGQFSDYFFGYMIPSTGYLNRFELEPAIDGFLMRYPDEQAPHELRPVVMSKLDEVFRQADELLRLLEVRDIGQLNEVNREGKLLELILVAEALHERRIAEIGQQIVGRTSEGARVILIAGPTSSGKTTFSKRLAIQLMTHGLKPFTLELDNYFVDRHKTPRDEQGEYDFEALEAINRELLNEHLQALIAGQTVQLPKFNFHTGQGEAGREVQLSAEHVIIMEGIHGLNPALLPAIQPEQTFRIYISALTQLNIDRYNRVSTTDVRLLRRIVRDAISRGWDATETLTRWESVGRGERRNIYPYQEQADAMFNSALVYELAALKPYAEPHLLRVRLDHPKWSEANRLLSFLAWVRPTSDSSIPDNSILREFIGQSNLRDFHPGVS